MKCRASTDSSSFLPFNSGYRNVFHITIGIQFILFLLILFPDQSRSSESPSSNHHGFITGRSLRPASSPETSHTLFERLSHEATQVDYANIMDLKHPMSYLNYAGSVCGGIAIGDINGDGKPDLYFVSAPHSNKLYIQEKPWIFRDVTEEFKVSGDDRWGAGAAMVDIDNDGDLDLYVCNYDAPNQLFINQGHEKPFMESAASYGLDMVDASLMPAFADYDNDGDLDVYVLTYRYVQPGGRPTTPPVGVKNDALISCLRFKSITTCVKPALMGTRLTLVVDRIDCFGTMATEPLPISAPKQASKKAAMGFPPLGGTTTRII